MTKEDVLEQIYPDEIEIILRRYIENQRVEDLKRYEGYLWQMRAGAADFQTKNEETLFEIYTDELLDIIERLLDENTGEKQRNIDDWYEEYESLKNQKNPGPEEKSRMQELKRMMNEHIDREISKLKELQRKHP